MSTCVGTVAGDLLGQHHSGLAGDGNDAVGGAPAAADFGPRDVFGLLVDRKQQHALGRSSHHAVDEHDEAVDVLLLVYHVLDKGMHLAVGVGIVAENERMAAMSPRRGILRQDIARGGEPAALPAEGRRVAVDGIEGPQLDDAAFAGDGGAEEVGGLSVYRRQSLHGDVVAAEDVSNSAPLCRAVAAEACHHLRRAHVVQHSHQLDVVAARVGELAGEEGAGADVVHPYGGSGRADVGDYTLDGDTRDEKFLQEAAVKLGQFVDGGESVAQVVAAVLGAEGAVAADDGLDKTAYQVVGQRLASVLLKDASLAYVASVGGADDVAPLVAVGEAFEALAPRPHLVPAAPGLAGRVK